MPHPMDVSRRRFLSSAGYGAAAMAMAGPLVNAVHGQQGGERKIGWALVGLGRLTQGELLGAIRQTRHCRLAALVSGDIEKARRLARANGLDERRCHTYDQYERLGEDAGVDVIYIVLPNGMHAEYTIRGAKLGKHIFCEKPMATSSADCQAMIDACNAAKKKLAIAYRVRYEPVNQRAIQIVREKRIGEPKAIVADAGFTIRDPNVWRLNKKLAGGGALLDIGIYSLNATRYLTGEEPVEVNAMTHTTPGDPRFREVEETCVWQLKFPSGVLANCSTSYSYSGQNRYRVIGTGGWMDLEPATNYRGNRLRLSAGGPPEEVPIQPVNHFAAEMDAFAESVLNDKPILTPGEEGLRDLLAMEAIYEAAREGKRVSIKA